MNFTALSLPLAGHSPDSDAQASLSRCLPHVQWIERKGPTLHTIPLSEQGEVLGLNLGRGCAHRCGFCFARAYPTYPGDQVLYVYRDSAEHLDEELAARRQRPRAVYVCPSTDPFPPLYDVQVETARVVEVLAHHGVEAWLMTRGYIRPAIQAMLAEHRKFVKVTVGLTTLERNVQRVLEPLTPSPRLRLRLIAQLRKLGISTQVALDPLVPGLTDSRENLSAVLQAVAERGVRQVSASYLFLRPGIQENLKAALKPLEWDEEVFSAFDGGLMLTAPGMAAARYLPKVRRQHGYARLMALAAELDIRVTINGMTNPDFAAPRRLEPSSIRSVQSQGLYPSAMSRVP